MSDQIFDHWENLLRQLLFCSGVCLVSSPDPQLGSSVFAEGLGTRLVFAVTCNYNGHVHCHGRRFMWNEIQKHVAVKNFSFPGLQSLWSLPHWMYSIKIIYVQGRLKEGDIVCRVPDWSGAPLKDIKKNWESYTFTAQIWGATWSSSQMDWRRRGKWGIFSVG